jgi:hypothetical protein
MSSRIKPWGETLRDDAVRGVLMGGFLAVCVIRAAVFKARGQSRRLGNC